MLITVVSSTFLFAASAGFPKIASGESLSPEVFVFVKLKLH